jgi:hypothetical protein
MHTITELEAIIPTLKNPSFAQSLVNQSKTKALSDKQMYWVNKLVEDAQAPVKEVKSANVGDLSRIISLFDKARQHLKFPAIVLNIPAANNMRIRINVAGERSKYPGSLNVTSGEKPGDEGRAWYGRVMKDGTYTPSGKVGDLVAKDAPEKITARLVEFAANPVKVAKEYAESTKEMVDGVLTGRCCFCNRHLQDERSTAVGYGSTCADHYGLPWGK